MWNLSNKELEKIINVSDSEPYNFRAQFFFGKGIDGLLSGLHHFDEAHMASKGTLVTLTRAETGNKRIRVYQGDEPFTLQPRDMFARALQHADAMIRIAELENIDLNAEFIKNQIQTFLLEADKVNESIQGTASPKDFDQAKKASLVFISAMAKNLADKRFALVTTPPTNPKELAAFQNKLYLQAFADIKKGTELFGILTPSEDMVCTVTKRHDINGQPDGHTLQISEKITFNSRTLDAFEKKKAWYQQGKAKHGVWFEQYMEKHFSQFIQSSPPCTTRDTPNASNAWYESTYQYNDTQPEGEKIVHLEQKDRAAISAPFNIKNKEAQVQMAAESMKGLFPKDRLEAFANNYIEQWQGLIDPNSTDPIVIPLMHQTLLAPGIPGLQSADVAMLGVKEKSNKQLAEYLSQQNISINGRPVQFELLQTNNCINMWHPAIIPNSCDIHDSNKLFKHATNLISNLTRLDLTQKDSADLQQVLKFLKSNNSSLLGLEKSPNKKQKKAIQSLSDKLFHGELKNTKGEPIFSSTKQKNLSLMLQASVNLKKQNHEGTFQRAMRKFKNAARIRGFSFAAPIIGLLAAPVHVAIYAFKVSRRLRTYFKDGAPPLLSEVLMPSRNQQSFKSAYESILAYQMGGRVFGGCKSAFDREGEANVNKTAMVDRFLRTGKLIGSQASYKEHYDYINSDVKRVEESGHQNRIAAHVDRIGARKMWETRTHAWVSSDSDHVKITKGNCAKFRKIKKPVTGDAEQKMKQQYFNNITVAAQLSSSLSETGSLGSGAERRTVLAAHKPPQSHTLSEKKPLVRDVEHSSKLAAHRSPSSQGSSLLPKKRALTSQFGSYNQHQDSYDIIGKQSHATIAQLQKYLENEQNISKHNISKINETSIENNPALEITFNKGASKNPVPVYAQEYFESDSVNDPKPSVQYFTKQTKDSASYEHTVRNACKLAIELATEGTEFNFAKTPADKKLMVLEIMQESILNAIQQGRFTEETCPKIVGIPKSKESSRPKSDRS
tara:strand:+ start:8049 stop:11075 length:3027 start_codon:yes stop_codon:yes gene_type:complete